MPEISENQDILQKFWGTRGTAVTEWATTRSFTLPSEGEECLAKAILPKGACTLKPCLAGRRGERNAPRQQVSSSKNGSKVSAAIGRRYLSCLVLTSLLLKLNCGGAASNLGTLSLWVGDEKLNIYFRVQEEVSHKEGAVGPLGSPCPQLPSSGWGRLELGVGREPEFTEQPSSGEEAC